MKMVSTSRSGAVKGAVKTVTMSLCVSLLVVGCSGGTAGSEESPTEAAPRSPESTGASTAEGAVCAALLPQQEGFNYFPPLILSERKGAPEALEKAIAGVEGVDASAVPDLEADLKNLAATMVLGRGEAKDFDYDGFVAAKVKVDTWISGNCL